MTRRWLPEEVLPHRPPMLLLSRIVEWSATRIVAETDVDSGVPFAEAGRGVPRWVGLECMAQAVGALDGIHLRTAGHEVPPGFLLGTRRLDGVDGWFAPGTTLRIEAEEVLQDGSGLGVYACRLDDGGRVLSCQLTVYRPPLADEPARR